MEPSPHRPPDPDLLERYVLGRLDQRERAEVEDLVRTAEPWREALRREQILAAGVRRLGRAGIRRRLAERHTLPQQRTIPWPRIAMAAAVMCIVAGVGIVNRWFVPSPEPDAAIVEQLSEHDEGAEPKKTAPPDIAAEEFAEADEAEKPPPFERGRRDKEEDRIAEDEKVSSLRAGVPKEDTDDRHVSAIVPEPPRASDSRTTSVFWTQGQLLAVKTEGLEKEVREETKEQTMRDKSAPLDAVNAAESNRRYRGVGEISQFITLRQQPFSTLDQARQQNYEQVVAPLIPTRIEQRGDSLYLTLYPDPPFGDAEMQTATAVPVTPDSLIVTVGSQQIGYHLPPSLIQNQSTKTRR